MVSSFHLDFQRTLADTVDELGVTRSSLLASKREIEELKYVVASREKSEMSLVDHAIHLRGNFKKAAEEIAGLHSKIGHDKF